MGLSSCLILLGGVLIYSFTGLTNFESIYSLFSVFESNNLTQGLNLGFIIMIVGLLFKIAAAPFHHWSPGLIEKFYFMLKAYIKSNVLLKSTVD